MRTDFNFGNQVVSFLVEIDLKLLLGDTTRMADGRAHVQAQDRRYMHLTHPSGTLVPNGMGSIQFPPASVLCRRPFGGI